MLSDEGPGGHRGLRRQGAEPSRARAQLFRWTPGGATTAPSSRSSTISLGDIDVIVTRSEKEAVLLENELIKKHQPRFNVRLRDDKDFIVLRLDERHAYPRLEVRRARQRQDDGARYFGPYSSASSIRETLRIVNRWFQLRDLQRSRLRPSQAPVHPVPDPPLPCAVRV